MISRLCFLAFVLGFLHSGLMAGVEVQILPNSDVPKEALLDSGSGASPYCCLDMVGNVWEWTDSKENDDRHWFSYLRGGSWFQPVKPTWYTENGLLTNNQRVKFWWLSPGLNRAETIGFRCVKVVAGD